jgi:hypothetical protein
MLAGSQGDPLEFSEADATRPPAHQGYAAVDWVSRHTLIREEMNTLDASRITEGA